MRKPALLHEIQLEESGLLAGDVGDHIAYRLQFFSFFIGHFDIELFFKCHDKFHGIERVCSEIFDEFGFGGDLVCVDAELVNDDVFYAGFDTFI